MSCGILGSTLRLYCWGVDPAVAGSLGVDPAIFSAVYPREINSTGTWSAVAAGGATTCGIQTDSSLWCWGSNNYGQLGDGTTTDRTAPTRISITYNGQAVQWSTLPRRLNYASIHVCAIDTLANLWWVRDGAPPRLREVLQVTLGMADPASAAGAGDTTDTTSLATARLQPRTSPNASTALCNPGHP